MSQISAYLKYLRKCHGRHGVHSPFVYDLLEKGIYSSFELKDQEIKSHAKELRRDKRPFTNDFGTNSGAFKGAGSLGEFARKASMPKKYGRLLARLTAYFKPKEIVELGTCLGMSSAYMASYTEKLITCEGNALLAEKARSFHKTIGNTHVEVVNASFDKFLDESISTREKKIEFVFIDGDHSYEATMKYFNKLLAKVDAHSILVFDDIHWSKGMEKAWSEMQQHNRVTLSLDFFKFGILFFMPVLRKQHFSLWY